MNRAGYDFATLGNHEFEITRPQLERLIAAAPFPILCANVTDSATGRPLVPRRRGAAGRGGARRHLRARRRAPSAAIPGRRGCGSRIRSAPLRPRSRELRGAGPGGRRRADLALRRSRWTASSRARCRASTSSSARTRTRGCRPGEMVWWSDELKPDATGGTVIVQAGQWGGELGRLDLLLDEDRDGRWRVGRHRARLVPVTSDIARRPRGRRRARQPVGAARREVRRGAGDGDGRLRQSRRRPAAERPLRRPGADRARRRAGVRGHRRRALAARRRAGDARLARGPRPGRLHRPDVPPARAPSCAASSSGRARSPRACATGCSSAGSRTSPSPARRWTTRASTRARRARTWPAGSPASTCSSGGTRGGAGPRWCTPGCAGRGTVTPVYDARRVVVDTLPPARRD